MQLAAASFAEAYFRGLLVGHLLMTPVRKNFRKFARTSLRSFSIDSSPVMLFRIGCGFFFFAMSGPPVCALRLHQLQA